MMDLAFERAVCAAFDLGTPDSALVNITEGSTRRLWKLTTHRGDFAVKELALPVDGALTNERIARAFELERAAFASGIRMPRPLSVAGTNELLAQVPRTDGSVATVRVHEWVEGEALQRIVYGADFAARVGGVISRIHALALHAGDTQAEAVSTLGSDYWLEVAETVERSTAEWKWEFRAILPVIADIEAYVASASDDPTPLVLGHRDADQKNWMKTGRGELLLIDWDAAGPVNPRHEVASLALTWAGAHLGEPDWKCVRAWITGYREGGGVLDAIRPTDLAEFAAALSQWFEYNARRAIGERPGDDADRKRSSDIVRRGFKDLPRYMRSVERWTRLLAYE